MDYALYYAPGTASMAVHWMLIELGVPFTTHLVDFAADAQHSADYLRVNPLGRVPTLVVDGVPRHESAALLMLLAELHPSSGLAPPVGSAGRAEWLEWMIYLANNLAPAMRDWFYAASDGDPAGADAVTALARRRIEQCWDKLDACLADGRRYLVADKLSTVDFLAMMPMRWSRNMPRKATDWPHLAPYIGRLRAMPSYGAVCDREGLIDWRNPPA